MNNQSKEKLKTAGIIFGIFIASMLILWGVSHLATSLKEDIYIKAANNIFTNSELASEFQNSQIEKRANLKFSVPNFCNACLLAKNNGKTVYFLFINMTGKYGVYQGVFAFVPKVGDVADQTNSLPNIKFCGLAGNYDLKKSPDYYGISSFIINSTEKKIANYFKNIKLEAVND